LPVLFFGTSGCLQLTYFCYFCLVSCNIATLKGCDRFLEQPHGFAFLEQPFKGFTKPG
jgi:hypothetical protein